MELFLIIPMVLTAVSAIVRISLNVPELNSIQFTLFGVFEIIWVLFLIHIPLLAFFIPTFFIMKSRRNKRKELIKNHDFEETAVLLEISGDSSPDADSSVKLKIDNFDERFLVLHRKSRFFEKQPKINSRYKVYGYKDTYALFLMEEKNGGN